MPISYATTFADPEDIRRYQEAIASGMSPNEALKVGDNGKGAWGDDTTSLTDPIIALPADYPGAYHNRLVAVKGPKGYVVARVGDTGAPKGRIDLNPAAAQAVGHPGGKVPVKWSFLDGTAPGPVKNTSLASDAPIDLSDPADTGIPSIDLSADEAPEVVDGPLLADNTMQAGMPDISSEGQTMSTDGGVVQTSPTEEENPEEASQPEVTASAGAPQVVNFPPPDIGTVVSKNPDGSFHTSTGVDWYGDPKTKATRQVTKKVNGGTLTWQPNSDKALFQPDPKPNKPAKPTLTKDALGRTFDVTDVNHPKEVKFPATDSGGTLEDPFAGLTDAEVAKTKALIEGRLPVTSRMLSSKDPELKKILDRALLADPKFSPAHYDERRKTYLDFTPGGKIGQNVGALNQTINHLGHLEEISEKIKGIDATRFQSWNALVQGIEKQVGMAPELRAYGSTAKALEQELAKLLKGGVATVSEVKEWKEDLSPTQSPEYRQTALENIIALLAGRYDTQTGGWERVFGEPPKGLITKGATKVLKRHNWDLNTLAEPKEGTTPPGEEVDPNAKAGPPAVTPKLTPAEVYTLAKERLAKPEDPNNPNDVAERAKAQAVIDLIHQKGWTPPGE